LIDVLFGQEVDRRRFAKVDLATLTSGTRGAEVLVRVSTRTKRSTVEGISLCTAVDG
jgi:hypothetical protein